MSFSDCQGHPLWVSSTCPLSLQPRWNHSPLTLLGEKKKKNHSREQSRKFWEVSSQTLLRQSSQAWILPPQRSPDANAANITRESYGFKCGTAWVSEFISFDFTQDETQGLNPAGRATEHPGWGLILCAVSLQFCTLLELGECWVKCHRCNLNTLYFKCRFLFFYLRKMGTILAASSLGKSVIQTLRLD